MNIKDIAISMDRKHITTNGKAINETYLSRDKNFYLDVEANDCGFILALTNDNRLICGDGSNWKTTLIEGDKKIDWLEIQVEESLFSIVGTCGSDHSMVSFTLDIQTLDFDIDGEFACYQIDGVSYPRSEEEVEEKEICEYELIEYKNEMTDRLVTSILHADCNIPDRSRKIVIEINQLLLGRDILDDRSKHYIDRLFEELNGIPSRGRRSRSAGRGR